MKEIIPHKYQKQILLSPKRYIAAIGGIQSGKTTAGVLWLLTQILKHPEANFLVGAPSYKILQQSTLEKLFEIMPEYQFGQYNKFNQVYKLKTGGKIYIRSLDDPESIEGLTVWAIWLDEAGQMKKRAWINALSRVSSTGGKILLTTTPYNLGWLYQDLYKPIRQKKEGFDNFELVEWRSIDSPYFPEESYKQAQLLLSPLEFERKYMGQFRRMTGLVYEDIFTEDGEFRAGVLVDSLPEFGDIIAGVDWGYRDPTAVIFLGLTPTGHLYVIDEIYKAGLTINEIVSLCLEKRFQHKVSMFYAGADEPSNINEFNLKGIPTVAANREVFFGISQLRAFIRTNRFHIHRNCQNIKEEFSFYHYQETEKIVEEPADEYNHAVDALRYIVATHPSIGYVVPTLAEKQSTDPATSQFWQDVKEDQKKEFERLKFGDVEEYDMLKAGEYLL